MEGISSKNWNIPKMHTHVHTFADIRAKGVTSNYDTKPSEGTHGAPKATYKFMSNGKEFEDLVWLYLLPHLNTFNSFLAQIMKVDHWQHVALIIRAQIDISEGKFDEDDPDDPDVLQLENLAGLHSRNEFHNIVLGAKQKPLSFAAIESLHSGDPAFKKFQERFCSFLSMLLPTKTVGSYKSIFTSETTVC
jgi:hypothetical protein